MKAPRHGMLTDELVLVANMGRVRYLTDRELKRVLRAVPEKSATARRVRREQRRRDQLKSR